MELKFKRHFIESTKDAQALIDASPDAQVADSDLNSCTEIENGITLTTTFDPDFGGKKSKAKLLINIEHSGNQAFQTAYFVPKNFTGSVQVDRVDSNHDNTPDYLISLVQDGRIIQGSWLLESSAQAYAAPDVSAQAINSDFNPAAINQTHLQKAGVEAVIFNAHIMADTDQNGRADIYDATRKTAARNPSDFVLNSDGSRKFTTQLHVDKDGWLVRVTYATLAADQSLVAQDINYLFCRLDPRLYANALKNPNVASGNQYAMQVTELNSATSLPLTVPNLERSEPARQPIARSTIYDAM